MPEPGSEYKSPIFDNGQQEPDYGNSPKITARHDSANDETCIIPGTRQECLESFPQIHEVGDEIDTDY